MRKLLYVLFASLFIFSCEKDETEGTNDLNTVIQPLKVGYSWTFIDSTFTNDGVFSNVDTSTVSVIGNEFTKYDGKEIELFYWKWDFYDRIWLYTIEEGTRYSYGLRENDVSYLITQSLDIPYPIDIDDTWNSFSFNLKENNDSIYGAVSDTVANRCVDKKYSFKTIIGELECIVTFYSRQTGDDLRETYIYHCPNIGYVGLENKVNNIITFKKTLMNYDFSNTQDLSLIMKSAQIEYKRDLISNSFGLKSNE